MSGLARERGTGEGEWRRRLERGRDEGEVTCTTTKSIIGGGQNGVSEWFLRPPPLHTHHTLAAVNGRKKLKKIQNPIWSCRAHTWSPPAYPLPPAPDLGPPSPDPPQPLHLHVSTIFMSDPLLSSQTGPPLPLNALTPRRHNHLPSPHCVALAIAPRVGGGSRGGSCPNAAKGAEKADTGSATASKPSCRAAASTTPLLATLLSP